MDGWMVASAGTHTVHASEPGSPRQERPWASPRAEAPEQLAREQLRRADSAVVPLDLASRLSALFSPPPKQQLAVPGDHRNNVGVVQ